MLRIFEPLDFKDAKPKRPQQTYVVQPGDTLAAIASRHDMKAIEVRAINNLWKGNVVPGQAIKLHHKQLRCQSLPNLSDADDTTSTPSANINVERSTRPIRKAIRFLQDPLDDEEPVPTDPRKLKSLRSLPEQQPQGGFFSSLFGNTTEKESCQEKHGRSRTGYKAQRPRLMRRAYSERLPTHREEQDEVYGLPTLIGAKDTELLSDSRFGSKLVPKIEAFLPMSLRGYNWKLLYSLAQHGSSLHTLMKKVQGRRATLIVVETCSGEVFGGFASSPWTNSLSYYGSGESFVFTTVPTFEVFNWKRTNSMFMYTTTELIAMGGGGDFAWFMDSDLARGTTGVSETYGNRQLVMDAEFDIAQVEVWGFDLF